MVVPTVSSTVSHVQVFYGATLGTAEQCLGTITTPYPLVTPLDLSMSFIFNNLLVSIFTPSFNSFSTCPGFKREVCEVVHEGNYGSVNLYEIIEATFRFIDLMYSHESEQPIVP